MDCMITNGGGGGGGAGGGIECTFVYTYAHQRGEAIMGLRASVAGASGYAGGELLRLLLDHPQLELGALAAGASAGQPVTAIHPHLPQLAGQTYTPADPSHLADADVVFLAL